METYDLVGKLLLSFIVDDDQHDVILDSGVVESDGSTVWYTTPEGKRYESITTANVVDVGLQIGVLVRREGSVGG